jgi:hypothetical protein
MRYPVGTFCVSHNRRSSLRSEAAPSAGGAPGATICSWSHRGLTTALRGASTKIVVVAGAVPDAQGTAVERGLWAWCEGARLLGHQVELWAWHARDMAQVNQLPEWCRFEPVEICLSPMWREHLHSLMSPRSGLKRAGWKFPAGSVVVADGLCSGMAVLGMPRAVVDLHYCTSLEVRALRRITPAQVQDWRAERRLAKGSQLVFAYSERVGRALRAPFRVVPVSHPMPLPRLPLRDEPVAALLADWSWPPNKVVLSRLLALWPEVREAVPGARLLIGGRKLAVGSAGHVAGVSFVGEVADSSDLLSQAAVLPFPCPPSSGPKVKVLEAIARGLPVVTTRWGVEGLFIGEGEGAVTSELRGFAQRLVELLRSPEQRAKVAEAGREAVLRHHSPTASAQVRISALAGHFGLDGEGNDLHAAESSAR